MEKQKINYSTNYMGPINMDWIQKNGSDWSGGRIDVYGTDSHYPDELSLPIMKTSDYATFSDWLDTVETDTMWTLEQLVTEYEKTHTKIVWHRTPDWESDNNVK